MIHRPLSLALACVLFASAHTGAVAADASHRFLVPANDGYGLSECLGEGSACGSIVADAMCETRGFGKSASFGTVDPAEITASVSKTGALKQTFFVVCGD